MGDARYNMGNSWMVACAKMGMHFTACTHRKSISPLQSWWQNVKRLQLETARRITLTEDAEAGTKGADVIYTDVWVSMGEPDEVWAERIQELSPLSGQTAVSWKMPVKQAVFMHCLPAFHDLKTKIGAEIGKRFGISEMEVTDEVFESPGSAGL